MKLQEASPGLWANIRAKRARGETPAHKNSKAHKDAVKAGKKINAEEVELQETEAENDTEFTVSLDHLLKKHVTKGGEVDEGLWANINAKKKRGGKSAPKGSKAYKAAKKAGGKLEKTKESVIYRNESLKLEIIESSEPVLFQEAEYQGRKVKLNKPMRGDTKKFKVYVNTGKKTADGGIKVKKVNFGHGGTSAKKAGEKTMSIRKSNPKARSSFRARHKCATPGPKDKARYWSCRKW